jgi:peptidoglycan/xylan/chitin deacetylase (PgdA/CDA1 family)
MEGLQKVARQLKSRFDRKAIILMYHRVADVNSDPWGLCVTPKHFAEQLEVLQEQTRPLRLQHLAAALRDGKVPRRSVVVTFDDGYADNLYQGRPALERYDIPATVFIATGYLEQERGFWWDELESVFLGQGRLPQTLRLSIKRNTHQWDLGKVAHYDEDVSRQHSGWRAWEGAPTARHSLYRSLWGLLQPLTEGERRMALDELMAWAGDCAGDRQARRALSVEEVAALAQGDLVEVGSHTVTHPVLSALPTARQQDEIRQSKANLEEVLARPVTSFAYPYGARSNYTDETVAIVRQEGFNCACSTLEGFVDQGADPYQLPRVQVQDWDGEEFARRLWLWLEGAK